MNPLSAQTSGRMLACWALRGRITLEDLDFPTGSWDTLEDARRSDKNRAQRQGCGHRYPPGESWRNLAREWIDANRSEWDAMLLASLSSEQDPTAAEPFQP